MLNKNKQPRISEDMKRLCILRMYGALKARNILPSTGRHISVKIIDRLIDYGSPISSGEFVRPFKDLLRWVYVRA
jgi:hypothetical protein